MQPNAPGEGKKRPWTERLKLIKLIATGGDLPSDPTAPEPAKPTEPAEPEKLIKLAKRAYDEVLDATKHQDDKVGRFLTAIAFLTTGAITLVATDNNLSQGYKVDDGPVDALLAWSTGAFFAFTLAAVVLLLLCLSVPVRLPKSARDPMGGSHLFYSYIAARPADVWLEEWKPRKAASLEAAIARDYVREAHNLAERVSAKYRHSHEASWLFVCALLFLGISILLRVLSVLDAKGDVTLGTRDLLLLASIVSAHAIIQIYTRVVHDGRSMEKARDQAYLDKTLWGKRGKAVRGDTRAQQHNILPGDSDLKSRAARRRAKKRMHERRNAATRTQRRNTVWLTVIPVTFTFAIALPDEWDATFRGIPLHDEWLVPLVVGGFVFCGLYAVRDRWDEVAEQPLGRYHFWGRPLWLAVAVAVVSGAVVSGALIADGTWRAVLIPLPALALGLFNGARPAWSQRQARKLQEEKGAARRPPTTTTSRS